MHRSTASPRAARRPHSPLIRSLVAGLLAIGLGGCGTTTAPTPGPGATDTPAPAATFTGGDAAARLDAPDKAAWTNGWCSRGADDAWLAVNIGDLNGPEYFGLVAGADPHGNPDASPAAGGGTFTNGAATVTWRHGGGRFVITQDSLTIVVAPDLRSGTFVGRLVDGREASGEFTCP